MGCCGRALLKEADGDGWGQDEGSRGCLGVACLENSTCSIDCFSVIA